VILVAGGLVGEGELRPDRDALADARSSDQEKRAFAFLTPGVHVVEPKICRISLVRIEPWIYLAVSTVKMRALLIEN
jgi:hypothetical protein